MSYASHKKKSVVQRRMRNARIEEQRTAYHYLFMLMRWCNKRMPWGPWKDIAYHLYRWKVPIAVVFLNGKRWGYKVINRIDLEVDLTPDLRTVKDTRNTPR